MNLESYSISRRALFEFTPLEKVTDEVDGGENIDADDDLILR